MMRKSLSPRSLLGIAATLLPLLLEHRSVIADCVVEGDMMFVEGQSIGLFGLVCVNETSFDNKDKVCGPNGEIILVTTSTENCPTTDDGDGSVNTPYCVQCGAVEQGAALCLDTMDVPEVCSLTSNTGDDAFGNPAGSSGGGSDDNFEMLPPSTPSSTEGGGGDNVTITFSTLLETITFSTFDQCDNSADTAAWTANNISQDDSSIQYCTTQWNGGCYYQGECTQNCFVELGFSQECSTCFGNVANCILENNCQSLCDLDEESEECASCRLPCVKALDECSGVSTTLINETSLSTTITTSATASTTKAATTTASSSPDSITTPSTTVVPLDSTTTTTTASFPTPTDSTFRTTTSATTIFPTSTTIMTATDAPVAMPSPDGARDIASGGYRIFTSIVSSLATMGTMMLASRTVELF